MLKATETSLWSSVKYRAPRTADAPSLTREQMVGRIMTLNPSATTDFLDRFGVDALRRYLDHLVHAVAPRGSRWQRPGDTPAVVASARVG